MFKLCNQLIKKIKEYYIDYKTENNKIKELKNILNYLFKLDYYFINKKYYYEEYLNKQNTIYMKIKNINKIPNNITKLKLFNTKYLNNLPLYLKWLSSYKVNCNLPPKIIFISCDYCDIHNLPKSLTFLLTYTNIHNEIILNNNNIKNYVIKLLHNYFNIIYNNITFKIFNKHYCNLFYILK